MTEQLAKRATEQWVTQVLEQFNKHIITEKEACELLGLKRARLRILSFKLVRSIMH